MGGALAGRMGAAGSLRRRGPGRGRGSRPGSPPPMRFFPPPRSAARFGIVSPVLAAALAVALGAAEPAPLDARWAQGVHRLGDRVLLTVAVPIAWIVEVGEELRRVRLVLRARAGGLPPSRLLDLLEA